MSALLWTRPREMAVTSTIKVGCPQKLTCKHKNIKRGLYVGTHFQCKSILSVKLWHKNVLFFPVLFLSAKSRHLLPEKKDVFIYIYVMLTARICSNTQEICRQCTYFCRSGLEWLDWKIMPAVLDMFSNSPKLSTKIHFWINNMNLL